MEKVNEERKKELEKGEATQKLQKFIAPDILESICFTYKLIEEYSSKPKSSKEILQRTIDNIQTFLTMLEGHDYLTESGREIVLKSLIYSLNIYNDPSKFAYVLSSLLLGKRMGRPRDKALDYLIYILLGHFKYINKKKPQYKLVADFLAEQGFVKSISENSLKKRFERLTFKKVNKVLNTLNFFSILGILVVKLTPIKRREFFYNIIKDKKFQIKK